MYEELVDTREDALSKVNKLGQIPTRDQRPCLEAASLSITYQPNFDTNFEDRTAFITGIAKYTEEATVHAKLNELLDEGETYAVTLYTWRSCTGAMPTIHSNDQANRLEIYQTFVDIMKPQVKKLTNFMHFQQRAVDVFCEDVKRLCHPERRKDFVSEDYLLTLGKLINMFAVLDALKNIKSSINNDYSQYRRAAHVVQMTDVDFLEESQKVVMFLAKKDEITNTLKMKITGIEHYEDLLCDVVNLCMDHLESKQYLLPAEKHMLVKVVAFGLFLMDSSKTSIYKMDQKKKISLHRADKIFKLLQVVPMYGDMQIQVFTYITKGENFAANESTWGCRNASTRHYDLLKKLPELREEHAGYIDDIAIHAKKKVTSDGKQPTRSDEENTALYQLALKGITLLSRWTSLLTELFSWKLSNPADKFSSQEMPKEAEEYERAIRYNYSSEEKMALIELIAMIKGIQLIMTRMEGVFLEAISLTVYTEIQTFVQIALRDPLRQAIKDKKNLVSSILRAVRETCAHWLHGSEPKDDPCLKGKKDPKTGYRIEVQRLTVGPSSTQLYLVRTMLESLVSTKSSTGRKTLRKDIDPQASESILGFHKRSFFYKPMLNISAVLQEACDLSQLWFREFYLEMTDRIQFPIEMSMPWILTSHILETEEPSMTDFILYPLDLYSDSAQYALTKFRKRHLYDEIEAEVNLCFDQLLYKLSGKIFGYYKELAASLLLDRRFRRECESHHIRINIPKANRYDTLLQQRHLQLLGRSIDLNRMITQRVSVSMQKSLDVAISRFESGDLTSIMDLDNLLEVNRLTHTLLSQHLKLADFDAMLKEANHNVVAPYSRITLHVFWELCCDFLPSFCYNASTERFVRTIMQMGEPPKRDKPPTVSASHVFGSKSLNRAYSTISGRYTKFVGAPHLRCLAKLLGNQGIALIVEELLKVVKGLLQTDIPRYVKLLIDVMPSTCRLPKYEYTSKGIIPYYSANLESIIQFADLQTNVLPQFQQVGNAILFFMLIERNVAVDDMLHIVRASPFDNVLPKLPFKKKEKCERILGALEQRAKPLDAVTLMEKLGTSQQSSTVREANEINKAMPARESSMFQVILQRLASYLDDPVWRGPEPANGVMNIDECSEFHRLWSAIQFLCSLPQSKNSFTPEESFGEGLHWAGCTLVTLLGQQRRFEALDFSYHILRAQENDQLGGDISGINLKRLTDRIRKFQLLNRQIFNTLNLHHKSKPSVINFSPPMYQEPDQDDIYEF